jgi:hypothetical protein
MCSKNLGGISDVYEVLGGKKSVQVKKIPRFLWGNQTRDENFWNHLALDNNSPKIQIGIRA